MYNLSDVLSFNFCALFRHKTFSGNKYGLVFVVHGGHLLFGNPTKSKDEFPKYLEQFCIDYLHLFKKFPYMLVLRTMRSDKTKKSLNLLKYDIF